MPELPEVEVVCQGLRAQIMGLKVKELEIYTPQIVLNTPTDLRRRLTGKAVSEIGRRAKYLWIGWGKERMLIHLRMTGQVIVQQPEQEGDLLPLPFTYYQRPLEQGVDKHTHFRLGFADGTQLYYRDIRKFGRIELLNSAAWTTHKGLNKLGLEPLEKSFSFKAFERLIKPSQRSVKAFLLDQQYVAGLGNIYVDEALFMAHIRPDRPLKSLKKSELKALHKAIPQVLAKGIAAGGTSLKDYLHPDGTRGEHQDELLVYGRTGKNCLECQTPLERQVIAQRSSHFCPRCQQ